MLETTMRWLTLLGALGIVGACETPTLNPVLDLGGQGGAGWRSSSGGASSATWGMASGVWTGGAGGPVLTGGTVSVGGRSGSGGATAGGGKASSGGQMSTGGQTKAGSTTGTGGASGSGGMAATGGTAATAGQSASGGAATGQGGSATGGGSSGAGGASGTGGATTAAFNWGNTAYDPAGGSGVDHQSHNVGKACLAACHAHKMKFAGTVYQSDGTTAAANSQIGIIINGSLVATYSGSRGNFFGDLAGTDWASAQIAIRTAAGTSVMPVNATASGNCNSCHNGTGTKRIVSP